MTEAVEMRTTKMRKFGWSETRHVSSKQLTACGCAPAGTPDTTTASGLGSSSFGVG